MDADSFRGMSLGASSASLSEPDELQTPASETAGEVVARSPRELFWRRFTCDRVAYAAGIFIVLLIFVAIAAPLIVKVLGLPGPNAQDPNATDAFGSPLGPASGHPLGVDELGHDVLAVGIGTVQDH